MPLDFIKLCRERRIPYFDGSGNEHCRPGWVQITCPVCERGSSGFHLGWNKQTGAFSCWHCGTLDFWIVMSALLGLGKATAKAQLKGYWTGGVRKRAQVSAPPPIQRRPPGLPPPLGTGPFMPQHCGYLTKRGYEPFDLMAEWGLAGTAHIADPGWAWRIIIPIHDQQGRVVAYQGRNIGDGTPKYRMTPDSEIACDPDSIVYGIHKAVGDSVIIFEGATSVWRFGAGTVATLGIKWREAQANVLRQYKNRFIMFDPKGPADPEGNAELRAKAIAGHLSLFGGNTELIGGYDRQPGDFSFAEAAQWRKFLGM